MASRRDDRPQTVYLVTDGNSDDSQRTLAEAMLTKDAGIHVIVVVVGNWFNMQVSACSHDFVLCVCFFCFVQWFSSLI